MTTFNLQRLLHRHQTISQLNKKSLYIKYCYLIPQRMYPVRFRFADGEFNLEKCIISHYQDTAIIILGEVFYPSQFILSCCSRTKEAKLVCKPPLNMENY